MTGRLSRSLEPEARERLLVRIREISKEVLAAQLPPDIRIPEGQNVSAVLPTLLIDSTDEQLIRLLVQKGAMDVMLSARVMAATPVPDATTRAQIERSINRVVDHMGESLRRDLGDWLDRQAVNDSLSSLSRNLLAKIDARETYAFKVAPSGESIDTFLAEFDQRLAQSRARVAGRLSALPPGTRETDVETSRILLDILGYAGSFLALETSDQTIANQNPDDYVPGYTDLISSIGDRESELREVRYQQNKQIEIQGRLQQLNEDYLDPVLDENLAAIGTVDSHQSGGPTTSGNQTPAAPGQHETKSRGSSSETGRVEDRGATWFAGLIGAGAAALCVILIVVRTHRRTRPKTYEC